MKSRILEVLVLCFALALEVNAQTPMIISQPQSATNNVGSAADFAVVATNVATYQWEFDGASVAGATNATLSLDDLSTNQAGSYTVVVTSSDNNSVTSAPPAVLTVVPGTIIQWTISTYPGGGSSNFLVQLFDHDKPATVENFIHYITSGAYSNMFFDRDVANFVLQGGDDVSADRTTNALSVTNITPGTNFPSQVASEFGVGPLIHNTFGTLAMALLSGETNSANSAFFFNETNNSAYLDGSDFTVFGRILFGTNSGSNVLQYFNTLSAPAGGIDNYSSSNLSIPTLPVNYDGTNAPTDASLFYCDFTFLTPPPVDTTSPTVSITFPAPNAVLTNAGTVTVQGTAQDNVGLAEVFCVLTSSNGVSTTNVALGTTNWSLNLGYPPAGVDQLTAYAQDGAGNLSAPATEYFTALIPPMILSQPTNLTILVGSSADFSVTAANAAGYQWQLVGTGSIAGATNATLVLSDVGTNLTGSSYDVIVTAPDGQSVTSAPVVLTVVTGTVVQITFSGFPDGSSSNVVVQLYDHDKPATVANFLRYITWASYFHGEGSYLAVTNMVWDRCLPGFILQGGGYGALYRTNGNPLQDLFSIHGEFTEDSYFTPPFPSQVDNEFDVGPLISNTFGTLAMAKTAGYPDSAANAFFFNLADNSADLDNQNGGYTVFGRLMPGSNYLQSSNVLQYFNMLSKPTKGIFDSTTVGADQSLTDLPVNYDGWGAPDNSNLFYGDFTLLSTYNADTVAPTVAITFPANGQMLTNADVVLEGTASDNVALANVACFCSGSNYDNNVYAMGTTNWSAEFGFLPPGTYTNLVYAEDGSGNESTAASNVFVVPRFPFLPSINGKGTLSTNLNPTNSIVGDVYTITAKPGKGAVFANWDYGTNASLDPTLQFILDNGVQATANFVSNNVSGGIAITSPAANAELTNATISIKGKLAASLGSAQVTCRVYSAYTLESVTTNMVIPAAGAWATPAFSLAPGNYYVQAIAQNSAGRASLVTREFGILTPLTVIVYGQGRPFITNGTYLNVGTQYSEGVVPERGESFVSWNEGNGAFTALGFPFVMSQGLTLTLTLVSNSWPGKLTLTSPAANSQVTNRTVIFGGKIASQVMATQIVCQIFQNGAPLTDFMPAEISGTNWTLPVSNLTMGIYSAVAIATGASGNTTLASEQFTVNFYPNIAGSYKGLFFDPSAVSLTSAGYLSFRLTSTSPSATGEYGVISGDLTLPLRTYPFTVIMDDTGAATVQPAKFDGSFTMSFDVTNFSSQTTGSVTQGSQTSPLTAYRSLTKLTTNTVPSPGHYVLSLEPETPTNGTLNGPPGDSFAAVTASAAGNLAVAGTLADDSAFSQSTGAFTNGVWPLYASFYKGHGMLIGWETNLPSGDCAGTLFWIKSPTNGLYDTAGVDEQLNGLGANYVRPPAGPQYQIVLGGGTLTTPVTNIFSFNAAGAMVPAAGATNKLTGSVAASTGVLKGSITNPSSKKTLDFSGVFLSPSEGGSGFTLDVDAQTGYFDITPVPAP